mgnify:CR=1 FL=1
MTQQEIKQIYDDLYIKGLIGELQRNMQYMRSTVSRNTILKAFRVSSYEHATPLQQKIIDTGKGILQTAAA